MHPARPTRPPERTPVVEFLRHVAPPLCPDSIGAPQKTRKFSKLLIANEMHSRKCATQSKHATSKFLIANEIQSLRNANRPSKRVAAGLLPVSSLVALQACRSASSSSEFLIDTPAIRIVSNSIRINTRNRSNRHKSGGLHFTMCRRSNLDAPFLACYSLRLLCT